MTTSRPTVLRRFFLGNPLDMRRIPDLKNIEDCCYVMFCANAEKMLQIANSKAQIGRAHV